MKLRYTETFYSLQGEGRYVGVPSVFLRLFGCNFKCAGFGMPRGTVSEERNSINPDDYKTFDDLPLVTTGCDSYSSWDPRFKRFAKTYDIDSVVDELLKLTPSGSWIMPNGNDIHLIITGGEPLLGWQRAYPELFNHPRMKGLKNVTFETNTTQPLTEDFEAFLRYETDVKVTFSCSPKLTVSGEAWEEAIRPKIARQYYGINHKNMYFKFVVADEQDVDEVTQAVNKYRNAGVNCPVYCMPLGGCTNEYQENRTKVAELCLEKGWYYTPRLHISLFGNAWGT